MLNIACPCSFKLSNSAVGAINLNLLSNVPPLLIPCFALPFSLRPSLTQERPWRPFWSTWRPMSPRWSRLQGEPACLSQPVFYSFESFSEYNNKRKDNLWYCHSRSWLSNLLGAFCLMFFACVFQSVGEEGSQHRWESHRLWVLCISFFSWCGQPSQTSRM